MADREDVTLLVGDCRALLPTLPAGSVHCCVTSPPYYGLRDYQTGAPSCSIPSPAAGLPPAWPPASAGVVSASISRRRISTSPLDGTHS